MAAGWLKSLQCKSSAYDDVISSTSCRNSHQSLKDVVVDKPKPKPKSKLPGPDPFYYARVKRSQSVKPKTNGKEEEQVRPSSSNVNRVRRTLSAPIGKGLDSGKVSGLVGTTPFFPSVKELTEGDQSRNVVEIIFTTRWGPGGFSGRVEMVFKIQSPARVLAGFEEYRDSVKIRAGSRTGPVVQSRCVADGNEMMRFHCLGEDATSAETAPGIVCTFSGSGAAHESSGGGKGRRAMVVCRVIAGRVLKRVGDCKSVMGKKFDLGEFDSITGENGELLMFDSRAVLPCFLVILSIVNFVTFCEL